MKEGVAKNDSKLSELHNWIFGMLLTEKRESGRGGDHRFGLGCTEF